MPDDKILTLNAGSSSIKFALYSANAKLDLELHGQVENIANSANLQVTRSGAEKTSEPIAACDHAAAHNIPVTRPVIVCSSRNRNGQNPGFFIEFIK